MVTPAPATGVVVPTANISEAVVNCTKTPVSENPPAAPPPPVTQVPAIEKQPAVKLIPFPNVEVAPDVERIDPPVKVMPSDDLSPDAETPPTNVEVAEVAVTDNVPEVAMDFEESMVMSLGIESSVNPEMVPEKVGFETVGLLTVTFEILVILLVPDISRNNSSLWSF